MVLVAAPGSPAALAQQGLRCGQGRSSRGALERRRSYEGGRAAAAGSGWRAPRQGQMLGATAVMLLGRGGARQSAQGRC